MRKVRIKGIFFFGLPGWRERPLWFRQMVQHHISQLHSGKHAQQKNPIHTGSLERKKHPSEGTKQKEGKEELCCSCFCYHDSPPTPMDLAYEPKHEEENRSEGKDSRKHQQQPIDNVRVDSPYRMNSGRSRREAVAKDQRNDEQNGTWR